MLLKSVLPFYVVFLAWAGNGAVSGAVSPAQVQGAFGSDAPGMYTYVNETEKAVYFIDLSQSVFTDKRVVQMAENVFSPLVSPCGRFLAFWTGNSAAGTLYACRLQENATAFSLGAGFDPHWWVDPLTGKTYLIHPTAFEGSHYPQPGQTLKRELDTNTLQFAGAPEVLLGNSFNGGLSRCGQYLATAYLAPSIYDIVNSRHFPFSETQACNGSISPSNDSLDQARMLMLGLGITIDGTDYAVHEVFYIKDRDDFILWYQPKLPSVDEWQKPEWSTHPRYAAVLGSRTTAPSIYDAYLAVIDTADRFGGGQPVKVKEGLTFGCYPHLYVPGYPASPSSSCISRDTRVYQTLNTPPLPETKKGFCGNGALMAALFAIGGFKVFRRKPHQKKEK